MGLVLKALVAFCIGGAAMYGAQLILPISSPGPDLGEK